VIIGDANLSEVSTYLKVGTTSLVLTMIEAARSRSFAGVRHMTDGARGGLMRNATSS